jgi:hypothetical protein
MQVPKGFVRHYGLTSAASGAPLGEANCRNAVTFAANTRNWFTTSIGR